jgi:cytochrome d ubiquinol oxidase subunit II
MLKVGKGEKAMFDCLFNYEVLRIISWIMLGVFFAGFAVMDGFDLGVATLLPFIGRKDIERRTLINTVGPFWEGNQVWLILGGGALFGAWPLFYAVLFSGLYLPLFGILCALILRPVGFKFRSKVNSPLWRSFWDGCLFIGGVVPALSFGIVLGVLGSGLSFYFDPDLRLYVTRNLLNILRPLPIISGVLWLGLFLQQGACFLGLKTEDPLAKRARKWVPFLTILSTFLFGAFLVLWRLLLPERFLFAATPQGFSSPLIKSVIAIPPTPITNVWDYFPFQGPYLTLFFIFAFLALLIYISVRLRAFLWALILQSLQIIMLVFAQGWLNFPFILISRSNVNHSLTVWDASSSLHTLRVVFLMVIVLTPIVIAYTSWFYRLMRGKVKESWVKEKSDELY